MPKIAKTVDEYLKQQESTVRNTLGEIRKAIVSAAPKAEEVISYRIPIYRYKGDLIAFAAFKKHCSFITMSSSIVKDFNSELKPYKISGTTIQFPFDKPLPEALIKKIIKVRIKENEKNYRKKVKQ